MSLIPSRAVLPIAIAAFIIPILVIEIPILQFTHGTFAYPIDDTCIHLAIAKNLAFHGVWGVTPHEFVSSASSILYPLLLAAIVKIVGAHLILPFLINFAAAIALLFLVDKWLIQEGIKPFPRLLVLLAVIFLTPLPVIVICGMEHSLHLLLTFLFITQFSQALEIQINQERSNKLPWTVYLYGALMASARYEGIIIVAFACLALAIQRRLFLALQLGIYSMIPIVVFGFFSLYHGNYFIPNSVLLKSGAPPLTAQGLLQFFYSDIFKKLYYSIVGYNTVVVQRLLLLLPLLFLVFYEKMGNAARHRYILLLLTSAVFMHLILTGYASFPRYEAYLVGCAIVVSGMLIFNYGGELFNRKPRLSFWITCLFTVFLATPLVLRSNYAFGEVGKGSYNTYEIQYQAGLFLHAYYFNTPVLVEALGGASYYSEGKKLDVVGLGDIQVTRSLREHYYGVDFLDFLSKKEGIKMAIASENSNYAALLAKWKKIATWQVPMHLGGYYVSFFAVDSSIAPELKQHLIEFQRLLPADENVIYH